MRRVFPAARSIERETAYLTEEQQDRVAEQAGEDAVTSSALAPYLVARGEDGVLGYGYLDTRDVRTLPATLLVVVDKEGRIAHVEILAFREPPAGPASGSGSGAGPFPERGDPGDHRGHPHGPGLHTGRPAGSGSPPRAPGGGREQAGGGNVSGRPLPAE